MDRKSYQWCAAHQCYNTSIATPEKIFITVPSSNPGIRRKWLRLAGRHDASQLSKTSSIYLCEDHFDLPNDMENYTQYRIMGSVKQIRMKPGCTPSKFNMSARKRTHLEPSTSAIPGIKSRKTDIAFPETESPALNQGDDNVSSMQDHSSDLGSVERKLLKAGVVPTVFSWTGQNTTQVDKMAQVCIKSETEDPATESPDFGACFFCETYGEHSSMQADALGAERASYLDMLLECFNILLSTDETACSLICAMCAARLRDARDFKQLVLRAQRGLRPTVDVEASMDVDIKQESVEAEESEELEPGNVVVKVEPDLDIVEHEVTRRPDNCGVRDKEWTEGIDFGRADQNVYAGRQESVEEFLEAYYNGQDDDEEESDVFEMPVDKDVIEMDEETVFLDTGCGCKLACLDKFVRHDVLKSRLDCLEQDYYCYHHVNHLNLMMLGALSATADVSPQTTDRGRHIPKARQRAHVGYWFRGLSVCKKFFLFVHGLNSKKYEKILRCFRESGVEAITHGNKKSLMTKQQQSDVVTFISNFSIQNSLVLPGRSLDNMDLHILPSCMTRTTIYERYVRACKQDNKYPVSRPLWYRAWDNYCPNVTVKLVTDPCRTCQDFMSDLSRPQPDNIKKRKRLNRVLDHLNHVQVQRDYYQSFVQVGLVMEASLGQHAPSSYDGLVHYSFDYLQHIQLPHYRDKLGPLDFLNGYKVSLFGIAIERLQKFVLYVIPEHVPKGVNLVVSLLHRFFDTYALGQTHAVCHTVDNQNKNSTLIQYALWRVMSGLHKSFQLSFLPSGHAAFAPDLYFGLFKSKFREADVNCLMHVCQVAVADSSDVRPVIVASETGERYVNTYDWKTFFNENVPASIPNLSSFAHFKTDSLNWGSVMCSTSPNDYSDPIEIFSKIDSKFPNIIQPEPLSFERQEYLYKSIRSFVSSEFQDLLCPIPNAPDSPDCKVKEELSMDSIPNCKVKEEYSDIRIDDPTVKPDPVLILEMLESNQTESGLENQQGKRKACVCSYCGEGGHRNQMKQGRYVCTKRQLASETDSTDIKQCEQCVTIDLDSSTDNSAHSNDANVENNRTTDHLDPKEQSEAETSLQSKPKKRPACSYCGLIGHRNLIKHGIYFCKKRWSDRAASVSNTVKM